MQVRPTLLGEGHIRIYGVLQIGHTIHEGHQRLMCWPFPGKKFFGFNREDFVFTRPPGVERFVLSPDNVWYGRLKLLFTMAVKVDGQEEPVDIECAYVASAMKLSWNPQVNNNVY